MNDYTYRYGGPAESRIRRGQRGCGKTPGRGVAPGVGGASVIMVFVILCLTIFAALTLSTAGSEYNLSSHRAEAVRAYYSADANGALFVAELRRGAGDSAGAGDYAEAAAALGADAVISDGAAHITYSVAIDEKQALYVALVASESEFLVTSWRIVYTGEWTAGNNFDLWTGN